MYQARKVISVCIDLALLAWYIYVNKKGKIDTHTDHFPGLVHVLQLKGQDRYTHWSLSWLGTRKGISVCIDLALFIEVYVPSQESDQCVYRSWPFYWSTCTKRGKWSVCVSILPFLLKYMYQARKVISVCIDLTLCFEVHVPSQESDQCVYRTCTSIKRSR
jgi:hypothetical protein